MNDGTRRGGSGPLEGVRVVLLAAIGPAPYAAMLLADLGCDVIVVDRPDPTYRSVPPHLDPRRRGQRSIVLNLKDGADRAVAVELVRSADVLIEGMRPGVAERLGLGPEPCRQGNPALVYAHMTGWGQTGTLAQRAGHDINFVALSGALHAMGDPDRPPPVPLNLLGDYAGGGMFLVVGIVAALFERATSGVGQVVDGAIVDGVASLTAPTAGMLAAGTWHDDRGANPYDGSRPWYRTYRTLDDRYVAVGAIEDGFFATLLTELGLRPEDWPRDDPEMVRRLGGELEAIFASQDRAHWERRFADTDACVSPVLTFAEASVHPHAVARRAHEQIGDVVQPAPGPRLSRTAAADPAAPPAVGEDTEPIRAAVDRGASPWSPRPPIGSRQLSC